MSEEVDKIEVLNPEVIGAQLTKITDDTGMDESESMALRGKFSGFYQRIDELRTKALSVTDPEDPIHQAVAKDVRLGLKKERCSVENLRKDMKDEVILKGKAIDGFANVLKFMCKPVEDKLMKIEQHALRVEEARIKQLIDNRTSQLTAQGADPSAYNLGTMDEETFKATLELARKQKQEREEAARLAQEAEDKRIADEKAEEERIRLENIKLKEEADKREAEIKKEREANEAEKKRIQDEANARALVAKEKADKLQKEKDEAESKIAANKKAEDDKIAKEAADKKKAELAPDKEKLMRFIDNLGMACMPAMTSKEGHEIANTILVDLTRLVEDARKGVAKL